MANIMEREGIFMKKNAQRKIAFLMALLMVLSLMPVNLFGFGAVSVYAASGKDKTWSFMGVAEADAVLIQGTTGELDGLLVDATVSSAKFNKRAGNWAQFNTGTIIKVPVEGDCDVVVTGYDNAYTVAGTAATDKVTTYSYTGEAGYVELTATADTYLGSIKTVYAEDESSEAATEEVSTEASPEEETTEAATEKATEDTTTESSAEETTTEKATKEVTTEKATEVTTTEGATEKVTEEVTTQAPTQETTTEAPTQAPTQAPTESAVNPLPTVVKTAAIEAEGGSYSVENGTFTVTGAGSKFDKDSGKDSLYYVYFDVKEGTQSITAKVTPTKTAASGAMGIMARNGLEQQDMAAALYYDLGKNQVRIGRHGGAGSIAGVTPTDAFYVKLEFSNGAVYYTVAKDADFTDIIKNRSGMGSVGLDVRNIGFFATDGNVLTVSDIEIIANYKEDGSDEAVKKIVYSSVYGELIPQYAKSIVEYSSEFTFTQSVNGNELNLVSKKGGTTKGYIRSDKTTDYLLFPQTTENWSVKADVVINSIDSGTDKQGIAVGQFAKTDKRIYADIFQANKNKAMQHNFVSDNGGENGGNPKASSIDISGGATYTMQYTKYAANEANPDGYAVMTAYSAAGDDLAKGADYPFSLSNCASSLRAGQPVHYGLAISAADATVTNIKVTNEEGYIIYDQNDYYIAVGVAPVVGTVTGSVSEDRKSINVTWDNAEEGVGNVQYIVMVSKDGGEYALAGNSKINEFTYKPKEDGVYTFKVYGKSGESVSLDAAKTSNEVVYKAPIDDITVTATGSKDNVTVEFTLAEGATAYDVYRKVTSDGKAELIATINASDIEADAKTGKYVDVPEEEVPVYYSVTAKNDNNTSNPAEYMQALRSAGHTYAYAVGKEADKLTITAKTNDTVFDGKFSVTGSYAVDGSYVVNVNGKEGKAVEYKAGEAAVIEGTLENGRNDVEVIFTNASGVKSRTVFNFVNAPKYDILVDAAFTGTDGTETDGVPTYSTIKAALAAIASDNAKQVTVFVKNGTYNERVTVTAPNVSILGEDSEKTKIAYSAAIAEGTATSMWDRNAMYVDSTADGFTLENIWVENSYNYTNGNDQQADAIAIVADNVVVINAKLIGYQDTLLIDSRVKDSTGGYEVTNQYFYKCYITGNVDFIYGSGSAAFEDCDVVGRYTSYKADGCFTAARTYNYTQYGLIFNNCRFYGEEGIAAGAYRLARPWGADASTVFLNCYMDETVTGVGYGDMSGNLYKNARFAEYMSSGAGFAVNNDRPLLSKEQAAAYATEKVLGADFDYKKVMDSLYTGEAPVPSDTYVGNVNTELQKFTYDKETGYLSGQIVVVEWIDGVSTVPTVKPVMTFDSVDGTESIEVFVTPTGTNTYYFDRLIAGLTEGQEYVFHVTSGDSKNVSEYRTVPVYTGTSSIGSEGFLGNIGTTQSIKFKTAEDGTLVLYGGAAEIENAYTGDVNSSLLNVNCVTSETGNFVSGNIVVTEWVNGVSVVPETAPAMSFESVDGSEKLGVYIASIDGTNTYYFDRNLSEDMDTSKEYIFRISLTEENNISARKSMVVTTNYMDKKSGILWTTDTQLICYKTVVADGDNQLRVYALNK